MFEGIKPKSASAPFCIHSINTCCSNRSLKCSQYKNQNTKETREKWHFPFWMDLKKFFVIFIFLTSIIRKLQRIICFDFFNNFFLSSKIVFFVWIFSISIRNFPRNPKIIRIKPCDHFKDVKNAKNQVFGFFVLIFRNFEDFGTLLRGATLNHSGLLNF